MVGGERKKNRSDAGYRKFRSPLVYSGGPIRTKPKKKLPAWTFKFVLYLLILFSVIYFIFFSSVFAVKNVTVEGNNSISKEEFSKFFVAKTNIFRFDQDEIKRTILSEHNEIQSLDMFRGLPDTVKFVLVEREGKMVWKSNGENYLVSSDGIIIKKIEGEVDDKFPIVEDKKNIPIVLGSDYLSPSFISFVVNIRDNFFDKTNIKPTVFEVTETTFDVNLLTEAGFYVKFNTLRSSSKQLDNLKMVLVEKRSEIVEYVDLRIDGWAYYK